jgi:hypothetical protein
VTSRPIKFVFRGKFPPEHVFWREVACTRKKDPQIERLAKQEWERVVKQCHKEKKKIWDSDLYRFEGFEYSGGKAFFRVSTIPFSVRIGLRRFSGRIRKKGMAYAPLGMFSSCLVLSKDQKYLFIEKSDNYFTTRKLSWIGGVLSKTEGEVKSGEDLFAKVEEEVLEEIGGKPEEIKEIFLEAGYISESLNFCLLFKVKLNRTFTQLEKALKNYGDLETKRLIGIDKKDLLSFAKTKLPEKDWVKFEILGLF